MEVNVSWLAQRFSSVMVSKYLILRGYIRALVIINLLVTVQLKLC